MIELIISMGTTLFWNILQVILGCILSFPIYRLFRGRNPKKETSFLPDLFIIVLMSLGGLLMPFGTFGMVPILITFYSIGFKLYTLIPLLLSNAVFNTLIPYQSATFIWKTGYRQVILAFILAVTAGILLRLLRNKNESLIKDRIREIFNQKSLNLLQMIQENLNLMSLFILAGTIFHTLYHQYFWWNFLHAMTNSKYTNFIPRFFAGFNVVNPLFLLTLTLSLILMDFIKTAALLSMFKIKGVALYYAYFIGWACLLGSSAFI